MRVWFVTGASRGLGLEIVRAALADGDMVVATMREPRSAQHDLAAHERCLVLRLDVLDADSISAAVEVALAWGGKIDILINNAGRGLLGAIESTTDEQVRSLYEVNVFGLLAVTRHVLPTMRAANSGRIINIGSMGGVAAFAGTGVYASTKFAVEGITEAMRDELSDTGVRVTVIEPGSLRTDFMDESSMSIAAGPRFGEYDARVNTMIDRHLATNHTQPGDPARAAMAILKIAAADDPPTRLALGLDAAARTEAKLADVTNELRRWRHLTLSTAYDDASR